MLHKKTIMKHTIRIGILTQLSRLLGIMRELLMMKYLGVGSISDAFITAFKIPNSLRKVFAEGALTASFVPTIVKVKQTSTKQDLASLMSLTFIFFEGLCAIIVLLFMMKSSTIIHYIAPGFDLEQTAIAAHCLIFLMPLIVCVSSAALLGGALQATGHFTIPALGPAILNVVFISALCLAIKYQLSITFLCIAIVWGGIVQLLLHTFGYVKYGFSFGPIQKGSLPAFYSIFKKFLLCLPSVSLSELNLFVDTSFASLLSPGSVSLLYLANRFMGIPLGVLIGSFTTVLLPHFSHLGTKSLKRLSFYLHESLKVVLWVTIPTTIIMMCVAHKLFFTLFLSPSFTAEHALQAGYVLQAFLTGLVFLAINRVFLNVLYALHKTWVPACISLCALCVNIIGNWFLVYTFGSVGLALVTSLSALVQSALFVVALRLYGLQIYWKDLGTFLFAYLVQLIILAIPMLITYAVITAQIAALLSDYTAFLFDKIGYWFWIGPLCAAYMFLVWLLRKQFNVQLYFMDF